MIKKTPDLSGLLRKIDYDARISQVVGKYFTNSDYNKFTSDILDAKVKENKLVDQSDNSNLVKNSDLNTKIATLATKAEVKLEQDKIVKLQAFDSSYFHGKNFFGWWWFSKYVCLSSNT